MPKPPTNSDRMSVVIGSLNRREYINDFFDSSSWSNFFLSIMMFSSGKYLQYVINSKLVCSLIVIYFIGYLNSATLL